MIFHKLSDIPIALINDTYVLCAAFIYILGVSTNDHGHYTVGIKINDKWEIYDDRMKNLVEVNGQKSVIIHALFYLKTAIGKIDAS